MNDLIIRAKNGDTLAKEKLMQELEPIFLKVLSKLGNHFPTIINVQLRLEANKAFNKALQDFKPELEHADFLAFLRISVNRTIISAIKSSARKKYLRDTFIHKYLFLKEYSCFSNAEINGTHDVYHFIDNEITFDIAVPNEEIPWVKDVFFGRKNNLTNDLEEFKKSVYPEWFAELVNRVLKKQENSRRLQELFE